MLLTINIPSIAEQEHLVDIVSKATEYRQRVDEVRRKLDILLDKEIDVPK